VPGPSHGASAARADDVEMAPRADDVEMAPQDDVDMPQAYDDDDDNDLSGYLNTGADEGFYMPDIEPAYRGRVEARDPAGPMTCKERLKFGGSSQETPPAPAVDEGGIVFSPNTLRAVTEKLIADQPIADQASKKPWKRGDKKEKAQSQPPTGPMPMRVQDGPAEPKDIMWKLHIAGEPMLNKKLLKVASGSMRSLHDGIWFTEQRLLGEKNPSYPIYVAKVPKGHGFVETTPGDMIFLRFDDIFSMFHVGRLHYSLVHLFVLSMAMDLS